MATKVKLIADNAITTSQIDTSSLDSHFSGGTGVTYSSGEISIGQAVHSTDSPTFADLTLTGNLNITGDLNSYNVTDLDVTDQTITLGAGQTEALSGGSGIIVDGSNASILWDETNDVFDFNKGLTALGNVGIGITSLNEGKLHVKSDGAGEVELLTLENSTGTNGKTTLTFKTTSTDATKSAQIFAERVNASGHTDLAFRTFNGSSTERMRITSDARLQFSQFAATDTNNSIFAHTNNFLYLEGGSSGIILADNAANSNRIIIRDTNIIEFQTSDSEAMRIDSSGNLSIGPGTQTGNGDANITIREGNAFAGFDFKSTRTSGNIGGLRFYNTSSDSVPKAQLLVEIDGSYNFYNGSSGAQNRMHIDSSGNVGIGTTDPTDTYNYGKVLDIHGSTGAVTYLRDADATSNFGFVAYDGGSTNRMVVGGGGTAYLRFVSGGSECGRFDTSGRLLIGQDSGDAFNDDSMLRIQRTGDRVFQQFKCDADQNIQILFGDVDDDVESSIQYYPADKNLIFATGNNEDAMTINSSQYVGLGTNDPDTLLHLHSSAGNTILTIEADSDNNDETDGPQIHFLTDGGIRTAAITGGNATIDGSSINANALNLQAQTMRFLTSTTQDFDTATEKMRITFDGKVGIGTDDPSDKLEVSGTGSTRLKITNTDTNWAALDIEAGGNQANYVFFRDDSAERARIQVFDGNDISFSTGSSPEERLRITSSGNVGINQPNPAAQLHIRPVNDSGDAVVIIEADVNNDVETDNPMLYFKQDGAAVVARICYTSNNVFEIINQYNSTLIIGRGNTTDISINTSGVVSGDFNDTSDINLKENISNIDGGLSVVNQLRAVNFDWKSDEKQNGKAGFIAQEVEEILPNEIAENDSGKSINSTAILAHAIKAIQELSTKLEAAEARITELEG